MTLVRSLSDYRFSKSLVQGRSSNRNAARRLSRKDRREAVGKRTSRRWNRSPARKPFHMPHSRHDSYPRLPRSSPLPQRRSIIPPEIHAPKPPPSCSPSPPRAAPNRLVSQPRVPPIIHARTGSPPAIPARREEDKTAHLRFSSSARLDSRSLSTFCREIPNASEFSL